MSARTMPPLADLIGVPFEDCGRDPARGMDCWGLVMEVYRRTGVEVPDYGKSVPSAYASADADGQYRAADTTGKWRKVDTPEPGDLVAMHTDMRMPGVVNHFGVCLGGGKFIHTCRNRKCEVARLGAIEWAHRVRGYYRWQG
jgi:cell wall-associated NlpC family hydrolase